MFNGLQHLAARRPDIGSRRARTEDAVSALAPYLGTGELRAFICWTAKRDEGATGRRLQGWVGRVGLGG